MLAVMVWAFGGSVPADVWGGGRGSCTNKWGDGVVVGCASKCKGKEVAGRRVAGGVPASVWGGAE